MVDRLSLNTYLIDLNGSDEEISDKDFIVERIEQSIFNSFTRCTFQFSSTSKLTLVDSTITNCEFFGVSGIEYQDTNHGILAFQNAKVKDSKFSQKFNRITLARCDIYDLNDYADIDTYNINSCTAYNCFFSGTTRSFHTDGARFTQLFKTPTVTDWVKRKLELTGLFPRKPKSLWVKEITFFSKNHNTVFDKISIEPYYLSTKCSDKSSLDITGAEFIDDWSKLRKKYSGMRLIVVMLLSLTYFLPLILHVLGLFYLAKITEDAISKAPTTPLISIIIFGGAETILGATINCLTTIVVLGYNITRILLTLSIAKLREEEKFLQDSGFATVTPNPNKYRTERKIDSILNIVLWIVMVSSVWKIIEALTIQVPVLQHLWDAIFIN